MVNAKGFPLPNRFVQLQLDDGSERGAVTDDEGMIRLDLFPLSGHVQLTVAGAESENA